MSILRACLCALPLLLSAACHSVAVGTTYDDQVDFARLRTFDWLAAPSTAATAVSEETLLEMIGARLQAKGLQRDTARPDVLVAVNRSIEGTLNTRGSGYEFKEGRLRRYTLQAGTLVVDLVLPDAKEVAWCGTAEGAFRSDLLPAERQRLLGELLDEMFAAYPPRR